MQEILGTAGTDMAVIHQVQIGPDCGADIHHGHIRSDLGDMHNVEDSIQFQGAALLPGWPLCTIAIPQNQ